MLAAVSPTATQQALIPAAAGFDIRDTDEGLRVHGLKLSNSGLANNIMILQNFTQAYVVL
jgi:hypothetical protein